MAIGAWSVRNRVAVNIFTIVLLLAGYGAGFTRLTRALFPEISTNFIRITTIDPATSAPEDIERTITVPIEEKLGDVQYIRQIRSMSQDNISAIFLEVEPEITRIDPVLNDVRQAVDKAKADIPSSAEPPLIEEFEIPMPLIVFAVTYPPGYNLRDARGELDRLERRLKSTPGVSDVLVDGLTDRELWIEVDPFRLEQTGLSLADISNAVARKNINTVGGRLDGAGGQRVVRLVGEVRAAEELETLPIKETGNQIVLLRDVATVRETAEEEQTRGRVALRPSITFTIVKKKGADAVDAANRARRVFNEALGLLPEGFEGVVFSDTTKYVNTRIETVLRNGIQALVLVTLLLLLFLNWRLALLVAFGLPISFAGAFLVLYFGGYTLNLLSLFAMIMALGMVVDDAIVIGENVYRHFEAGESSVQAAIKGTAEVVWPVIGSVSTTVAAFLPLMWGEGIIGKFLVIVPIVVISTLLFSLFQAFCVLPSHLSDFLGRNKSAHDIEGELRRARGPLRRAKAQISLTYASMRESVSAGVEAVTQIYLHLLTICLRWRYWVVAIFVALFIAMGGVMALGVVRFKLFGGDFADFIMVKLELPADYSLDQTTAETARVERAIVDGLPEEDLVGLSTRIGARLDPTDQFLEYGSNVAMITVDVDEQNPNARKASEIERSLNGILAGFSVFSSATARAQGGGPPVGRAVNVQISGQSFSEMQQIAAKVQSFLHQYPGVTNIGNDLQRGKTELRVMIDEGRVALAKLDAAAVGQALQGAFRGIEAATLRWGNDEVTIRVKLDERFRHDPQFLRAFRIKNRDGEMIDLGSVAEIVTAAGLSRINRIDQERAVTVSSDVDDRSTTSAEINRKLGALMEELRQAHPGYALALTGENEDTERSMDAMGFAAIVALLLIYALLATISNSFTQPLVIMAVIPFGMVGVILGLIIMGEPLGLMSIMGMVALAGIVVNNSVVLVDFINRHRHRHGEVELRGETENIRQAPRHVSNWTRWRSIMNAGRTRLRPIVLTTATTVAGLTGLAFTTGGQEQFLAPMAQAVVFGLSFASLLTMLLIPCLYSILDDFKAIIGRVDRAAPEPASHPRAAKMARELRTSTRSRP